MIAVLILLILLFMTRGKISSLLTVFLVLFPVNLWISYGKINLNFVELLILMLFFLYIFQELLSKKVVIKWNLLMISVSLYVIYSLILILNTPNVDKTVVKAVVRTFEFGFLFFVLHYNVHKVNMQRLSKMMAAVFLLVCLMGIVEYVVYSTGFPESFVDWHKNMIELGFYPPRDLQAIKNLSLEGKTIGSTFASKSALSIYISMIIPFLFLMIIHSKKIISQNLYVVIFVIGIFTLFLTGSRTALLTTLISIGLITLFTSKRKIGFIIIMGIFAFIIFIRFTPDRLKTRLMFKSHESSFLGRQDYAKRSLDIAMKNFLLGAGAESLGDKYNQAKPHNAFLAEFQMKGIAGITFLFFIFLASFLNIISIFRRINEIDSAVRIQYIWCSVIVIEYFILSFAAEPFYENQTSVLFVFAISILWNIKNEIKSIKK